MTSETTIRVADSYGHPEFYPFMERELFSVLETAFLAGDDYAIVNAGQLEQMISDYKMNVTHETNE